MGELLAWAAEEGFNEFADWLARFGITFEYHSAAEFRSRHLTDAITAALKAMAWR